MGIQTKDLGFSAEECKGILYVCVCSCACTREQSRGKAREGSWLKEKRLINQIPET